MLEYKILVKDGDGDPIGEFDTFTDLTFGKKLNNFGECSFKIPTNDPKLSSLIALRVYTVEIYRDGVLIWAGEQANREGELNEDGDNWCQITCYDWLEQLSDRYTVNEKIYEYQDGTEIFKDLLNTTNADSPTGITVGSTVPTTWREKTYTNQSVLDAMISLANMTGGFDFEVTNGKELNNYEFKGIDRSDEIILEYGINIKKIRLTEDFSKPATRAIILGSDGKDQVRTEVDDLVAQGVYGLREYVFNQLEESEQTTFEDTGNAVLRKYGSPLMKVSMDLVRGITPTIDDFALGDIITLIVQRGTYDIKEPFRVYEWEVSYNDDNTETLKLTLSNFFNELS